MVNGAPHLSKRLTGTRHVGTMRKDTTYFPNLGTFRAVSYCPRQGAPFNRAGLGSEFSASRTTDS